MLYKYPQAEFPYEKLVKVNKQRSKSDPEYELLDTGIFDNNQYFDIYIEYAKNDSTDIMIRITVINRGADTAELTVMPTLWFRNQWSYDPGTIKPTMQLSGNEFGQYISADHPQ